LETDVMDVSIQGVIEARQFIYKYLKPTPLIHYPLLSRELGCSAYIKHENHNPTGAFKVRGGLNLVGNLDEQQRRQGVIAATRGNHGQSVALASSIFGVKCLIAIPEGNNPEKNEAMEAYGAELLIHGKDFDEAREKVESLQREQPMRYVHSGNEPMLIHGVGTYALEILDDLSDLDFIFVPIGGGSGAAGILTVVRAMAPKVKVIGVQAEKAPAVYLSWKKGSSVTTESADTIADGLATRVPFELTFSLIKDTIDDIVTVSEDELAWAVYQVFRTSHNLAEPAGAAALAGAAQFRSRIAGKKVVLILSGGNISSVLFREILSKYSQ
jgi:threonine dehydratase